MAVNATAAFNGTSVTSPTLADGTGNITLINIAPQLAQLVELRNISAALNTTNDNLDQARAQILNTLFVSGLYS